jgi:beta-lactamase superfamily II metal-dependent hydrolase
VTDKLIGRSATPLSAQECEQLTAPKLGFLDLRSPEASKDGNGLSMVYTLSDGSFIIYDGGFFGDAIGLVEYLETHNVRDEKPRIAAWVLTHSHGDHYFAMRKVAAEFADRVTVEDFVVNVRNKVYDFEQYEPYLNEQFETEALPKFEGAKVVRPHTGQVLCYRDARIEILSTQEEILPSHFRWLNETSIISRVCLGGQTIFMPADAELGVDVMIPAIYGDALKSDFIQETHHGFSGGSYTMYDLVRPKVAFWTCQGATFEKYCQPQYNNGYNYYLKNMVVENYHYGEGDVTLELPYEI